MASILKVDALQGVTAAGDITITSEGGAATQSLQQGLAKAWASAPGNGTSINDSLNISSLADTATGEFDWAFSTNFANAHRSVQLTASGGSNQIGKIANEGDAPTSSGVNVETANYAGTSQDQAFNYLSVNGDLA